MYKQGLYKVLYPLGLYQDVLCTATTIIFFLTFKDTIKLSTNNINVDSSILGFCKKIMFFKFILDTHFIYTFISVSLPIPKA